MDIQFSYGFYDGKGTLYNVKADLNASYKYYKNLKKVLEVYKLKDVPLVRIGLQDRDGGYIMADDFNNGGIAYSFGICDDVSWDSSMADYGYSIYMYDHTIKELPKTRDEFHFFKEGIAGMDRSDLPLKTLSYYLNKNGHSQNKNMILKMDVEGAEWSFLETVNSKVLEQFDQIVLEFHALVQAGDSDKKLRMLKKINKTHRLVHLHGNNTNYIVKIGDTFFPNVIEATYVRKNKYKTEKYKDLVLPIDIDKPNDYGRSDILLGKWNSPL